MRAAILLLLLLASTSLADDYPGSPAAVVAAYIEADGEGRALCSDTLERLRQYTKWTESPDWNHLVVTKSYDIGAVGWDSEKARDGDTAFVEITYHVLGRLDGLKFTAGPAKEEVCFDLVKTKGRWKIVEPKLPPHPNVGTAIALLKSGGSEAKPSLKNLQALE
jgi:hypothetical protein